MKFSKKKWLEFANAQIEQGILSQREVADAQDNWVNSLDGKTEEELTDLGQEAIKEFLI